MTNSRKVTGDVGSGWFMAEEGGRDGNVLKMFQIGTNKTFFEAEETTNPS